MNNHFPNIIEPGSSLVFSPGGELLPGDESDRRHLAHVPERGRCLLGAVTAPHQQQARHAWYT